MVPITCSCCARCRMFSSCLTYFFVPLSRQAPRRAVVLSSIAPLPACLPRVLSLPCLLVPSLCSSGGTAWRWASAACDYCGHTDVVRMSYGGRPAAGSSVRLASRLTIAPLLRHGRRGGERNVLVACFFRFPIVCRSRWRVRLAGLLACFDVRRSVPSCGMLCADFVDRIRCGCRDCFAMVYCHCVVGEDECDSGSSGFLSLVFLTRFAAPLFNSSPSAMPIKRPRAFSILSCPLLLAAPFDALRPVRFTHGGRGEVFFMPIISAVSWIKRRRRMR